MSIGLLIAGSSQAQMPAANDPYQGVPAPRIRPRAVDPPPRHQQVQVPVPATPAPATLMPATPAPVTSVPVTPSPPSRYPGVAVQDLPGLGFRRR